MYIVLYDGFCHLCSNAVQLIHKYDNKKQIWFAPLQSEAAGQMLKERGYDPHKLDSIVFVSGTKTYFKSDAALEIARLLKGFPHYLIIFRYLPKWFRDMAYDLVAKTRYRIFGKSDACLRPTDALQKRCIELMQIDEIRSS